MSQKHPSSKKILDKYGTTFQQLLEVLPDSVVLTDAMGKIQFVNKQAEIMFGYQLEELLGQSVEILIPERFDEQSKRRGTYLADPRQRLIGSGLESLARRKERGEFPDEIAFSPLETSEGNLTVAIIRDVTQRNLVVQDLKRSEARNRALLAAIPDLMFRVHRDGTIGDYHVENLQDLYLSLPSPFWVRNYPKRFPRKWPNRL